MPSATTHPNQFLAFQGVRFQGDEIVKPDQVHTDLVEVPACGFHMVTWAAEHPERGWESGVMLASKQPYADEQYARNVVSEVLWGRGYEGDYRVVVVP